MESIISSHVDDEGSSFVDPAIKTDSQFHAMVYPDYGNTTEIIALRDRAALLWPSPTAPNSKFKTQKERMSEFMSDYSFLCHNRLIADAYPGKVYTVRYAVPPSTHGSDQAGTFFNPLKSGVNMSSGEIEDRQGFQSYLTSFARSGSPNKYRNAKTTIEWPLTTGSNEMELSNVLNVASLAGSKGLSIIKDPQQNKERCQFWIDAQKTIEKYLAKIDKA